MIHFSLEISSGAVTKPLEQSLGDDVFVILFARLLICGWPKRKKTDKHRWKFDVYSGFSKPSPPQIFFSPKRHYWQTAWTLHQGQGLHNFEAKNSSERLFMSWYVVLYCPHHHRTRRRSSLYSVCGLYSFPIKRWQWSRSSVIKAIKIERIEIPVADRNNRPWNIFPPIP